jgi:GNAT superfamily N-acetyltransferase
VLRARRHEDLERLAALLRVVHNSDGYPANWPNQPARWLAAHRTIGAWVSEEQGDIVGHIALTAPDPDRSWTRWRDALDLPFERLAVMRRLFVRPDWRRRGVGTRLMDRAAREASARGFGLVLDVADHNHVAIRFWELHGWTEVGAATPPPGDDGRPLRLLLFVAPSTGATGETQAASAVSSSSVSARCWCEGQ